MANRTLVILKPGFQEITAKLLLWIRNNKFDITKYAMEVQFSRELMEKFYEEHKQKEFFNRHITYMCSGKCSIFILERKDSKNCIDSFRELLGAKPSSEYSITIRSLYGLDKTRNVMHASDSEESFQREFSLLSPFLDIQN